MGRSPLSKPKTRSQTTALEAIACGDQIPGFCKRWLLNTQDYVRTPGSWRSDRPSSKPKRDRKRQH
ncbi:MAG: hypothetical protein AAGD25_17670 [Cyanobacteria bacterium P01_F01_bin.150]